MYNSLRIWAVNNRPFLFFIGRFLLTFFALSGLYSLYLNYVELHGDLDLITYWISRGSYELALSLGVTECEWSCFIDGCYVGRPGKMVNIIEGCNGLRLAIVYAAYVIGIGGWNWNSLLQMTIGLVVVQLFNVIRIGSLIALLDDGGKAYFYFIKYIFGVFIYGSVIVLWLLKPEIDKLLGVK